MREGIQLRTALIICAALFLCASGRPFIEHNGDLQPVLLKELLTSAVGRQVNSPLKVSFSDLGDGSEGLLLAANDSSCVHAIDEFTSNMYSSPYVDMLLFSMHDLGDLGSYAGCNSLGEAASYYVVMMNITGITVKLFSGVCIPRNCTPADMGAFGDSVTELLYQGI